MSTEAKEILEELKSIRSDLDFIKEHMFDSDSILTGEENKRFEQSIKELQEKKHHLQH